MTYICLQVDKQTTACRKRRIQGTQYIYENVQRDSRGTDCQQTPSKPILSGGKSHLSDAHLSCMILQCVECHFKYTFEIAKVRVKKDRWKDRMHTVCIIYIFQTEALSLGTNSIVLTKLCRNLEVPLLTINTNLVLSEKVFTQGFPTSILKAFQAVVNILECYFCHGKLHYKDQVVHSNAS